jgi:hypothetical protein
VASGWLFLINVDAMKECQTWFLQSTVGFGAADYSFDSSLKNSC